MTRRSDVSVLKARWTPDALAAADRAFARMDPVAAHQGRAPPFPFVSPFGEYEGRADFRYLPLGATPKHRTIERADLTGATDDRNGQLFCSFVDCVLDRVSMETNLGDKLIKNSSFVKSRLSHTTLRGEFVDCDFSNADLTYSGSAEAKFIRCDFSGAKFKGSGFDYCLFDHCTWTDAKIANASFYFGRFLGSRPTDEQLADAMCPRATFEGC